MSSFSKKSDWIYYFIGIGLVVGSTIVPYLSKQLGVLLPSPILGGIGGVIGAGLGYVLFLLSKRFFSN